MYLVYLIGVLTALCIGGVLFGTALADYTHAVKGTASRMYRARRLLKLLGLIPLAALLWPLTLVTFLLYGASVLVDDAFGENE